MAQNPPTARGVMTASVPPQIMASASPRLMISKESPMLWLPVAQAVQAARLGPLAPKRMETWPAARLTMRPTMKKGEIRSGPVSRRAACCRSMEGSPPIPEPM